jgi:hypothetical protein
MVLDDLRVHATGVKRFGFGGIGRSVGAAMLGTTGEVHARIYHGGNNEQNRDDFSLGCHNPFIDWEKLELSLARLLLP